MSFFRVPPFSWAEDYEHIPYNQLTTRLYNNFDHVSVFGQDSAGMDFLKVELGTIGKPMIYITTSLHGSEWEGTIFTLRFLEELQNGTFIDRSFRNHLLANYHIVWIPAANPWGYHNQIRHNYANDVDLNRDFYYKEEIETQVLTARILADKPFCNLDVHLMQILYNSHELIFGVGDYNHMHIQDNMAKSWEMYMNGEPVRRWPPSSAPDSGLLRSFVAREVQSPWIFGPPISFISEITRETDNGVYFTRPEIMAAGMSQLYIYFKYMDHYFRTRTQNM
jgi:hypothetical protein